MLRTESTKARTFLLTSLVGRSETLKIHYNFEQQIRECAQFMDIAVELVIPISEPDEAMVIWNLSKYVYIRSRPVPEHLSNE